MGGLRRANTGTRDLKVRDPVDWKSAERKAEILLEMTLRGNHPKVVKISMITTILGCARIETKTETGKEIVASNEARRRIKLRAMKQVRGKMG